MSDKLKEIKIRELKNLFFYTFGIVPLQNYDIVGDGTTDNRLAIQQAINDAVEVGAKYIFVPKGEYYYSGTLENTSEVIFVGNNTNTVIRDIDIRQFPDLWNEAQATTGAITPIGGIILSAAIVTSENYVECNGQILNREEYPALYESITENIPSVLPDTFSVPNLNTEIEGIKYIIRAK